MIQIVRDRSKARPIFARVTSLLLLGTVFLNGCLGSAPPTTTTSTSTQDFSYDKLGQLIGISVNSTPSASFQFDPSGNLVSLTSGETTSAFTYNSLNQPTTPAGTTFDAKGQTTASGGKTFEWDDEGRLTAIVNGSARSEFGYDGYGRRISITEKSGATITSQKLYWWLGGSIVCERDGLAAGNPITKRYFGQGVLVGAQKLFYTFDQLGSVRELVDDTGAIRADYRYDSYGTRTKSAGDLDSDFGYAGLFHHAPSGLLLATHRAYDPVSHRWLSRDPLGEGVDLNLYRYCGNNPVNFMDPTGLDDVYGAFLIHYTQFNYNIQILRFQGPQSRLPAETGGILIVKARRINKGKTCPQNPDGRWDTMAVFPIRPAVVPPIPGENPSQVFDQHGLDTNLYDMVDIKMVMTAKSITGKNYDTVPRKEWFQQTYRLNSFGQPDGNPIYQYPSKGNTNLKGGM